MFIRKSTHETVVQQLNEGHRAEVDALKKEIATAKADSLHLAVVVTGLNDDKARLASANSALDRVAKKYKAERDDARAALSGIAALETPGCAHVGKKMAALARKALPGEATEPNKAAA